MAPPHPRRWVTVHRTHQPAEWSSYRREISLTFRSFPEINSRIFVKSFRSDVCLTHPCIFISGVMSAHVEVLFVGYCHEIESDGTGRKRLEATGTCTLIMSDGIKVLVDTMGPWDQQKLCELLKSKGVSPPDINHVICTHGHPDHTGNLNLFTSCTQHVVGLSVYHKDKYTLHPFEDGTPLTISPKIQVIQTPGHTLSCVSVLIEDVENYGRVVVAGDLFESQNDLTDDKIWMDAGSENPELQKQNRMKVLSLADYIIPGHGDIFKVPYSSS